LSTRPALQCDQYYHIFNRGNNRETLFRHEGNYHYFLGLYTKHIHLVADTFAYCLLSNHFHLLVQVKSGDDFLLGKVSSPSQRFGNLFNAYTKAINKIYRRTGNLFEKPFHRKLVTNEDYFRHLVTYIHYNPQKHGLIDDFRLWPFSSYSDLLSNQPTPLKREEVLASFGDLETFIQQHDQYKPGKVEEEFT